MLAVRFGWLRVSGLGPQLSSSLAGWQSLVTIRSGQEGVAIRKKMAWGWARARQGPRQAAAAVGDSGWLSQRAGAAAGLAATAAAGPMIRVCRMSRNLKGTCKALARRSGMS
jgi:hypothetical protein